MNHREPPLSPAGLSKALNCLLLGLLPVTATVNAFALTRIRPPGSGAELHNAGGIPYLSTVGAPVLRFRSPPLPPAPPLPLHAGLAPVLRDASEDATVLTKDDPAQPDPLASSDPAVGPTKAEPQNSPDPSPGQTRQPQPILRDSLAPTIRAEDFLPFFQIPGSARDSADVTLLAPATPMAPAAPTTIPPSSATYRQTP
jgi:hypothetical protein